MLDHGNLFSYSHIQVLNSLVQINASPPEYLPVSVLHPMSRCGNSRAKPNVRMWSLGFKLITAPSSFILTDHQSHPRIGREGVTPWLHYNASVPSGEPWFQTVSDPGHVMIIVRVRRLCTIFSARESEQLPTCEAIKSSTSIMSSSLNWILCSFLEVSVSLNCFKV